MAESMKIVVVILTLCEITKSAIQALIVHVNRLYQTLAINLYCMAMTITAISWKPP